MVSRILWLFARFYPPQNVKHFLAIFYFYFANRSGSIHSAAVFCHQSAGGTSVGLAKLRIFEDLRCHRPFQELQRAFQNSPQVEGGSSGKVRGSSAIRASRMRSSRSSDFMNCLNCGSSDSCEWARACVANRCVAAEGCDSVPGSDQSIAATWPSNAPHIA